MAGFFRTKPADRRFEAPTGRTMPDRRALALVKHVCHLAGKRSLIDDVTYGLADEGVLAALDMHDTPALYNWMVRAFSFQGISDYVAADFMDRHGSVTWDQIEAGLAREPACFKLRSYWDFDRCGYNKTRHTCGRPSVIRRCPLPAHPLRNGRLNQLAYSLHFFLRDVAGGDLAGWLDWTIEASGATDARPDLARDALLEPLRHIYGVSDKMLTMLLSDLLIGGSGTRPRWLGIGAGMIVVDTLVHNFLWRSGILHRHRAVHNYGPLCYGENGCANIIRAIARRLDARDFNAAFPASFPRFVQHAIWRFCAQQGLDICNGNRIADGRRCTNDWCPVFGDCDKVALRRPKINRAVQKI
jgi:hypothetical protein